MKRVFLLLSFAVLLLFPAKSFSQITWTNNMKIAKAMALAENKLILIDFWATWCGPCRKMEEDFWNTDKVNSIKDKVIFLKIDIDTNRSLAAKFGVRGIPYIVLVDIADSKIWDITGYQNGNNITKILQDIPNVKTVNNAELPLLQKKETGTDLLNIGKVYANIAQNTKNKTLRKGFFNLSNRYFKKVKDKALKDEVELRLLLNKAYRGGRSKKLLKKVNKIPETASNKKLRQFVISYIQEHKK